MIENKRPKVIKVNRNDKMNRSESEKLPRIKFSSLHHLSFSKETIEPSLAERLLLFEASSRRDKAEKKRTIFKRRGNSKIEEKKRLFNKLYGFTDDYIESYKNAKKKKRLCLEEYQNNILSVYYSKGVMKKNFIDLKNTFRDIRDNANVYKPLPPVNFDIIYQHSKDTNELQCDGKRKKKKSLKAILFQKKVKDPFEKEMELIKKEVHPMNKSHRHMNRNLYMLPEHFIQTLQKKLKMPL